MRLWNEAWGETLDEAWDVSQICILGDGRKWVRMVYFS